MSLYCINTRYNLLDYHYAFDVVIIPHWDYNFQFYELLFNLFLPEQWNIFYDFIIVCAIIAMHVLW